MLNRPREASELNSRPTAHPLNWIRPVESSVNANRSQLVRLIAGDRFPIQYGWKDAKLASLRRAISDQSFGCPANWAVDVNCHIVSEPHRRVDGV